VRTQETFDYWDWDEVGDNNDNPDNVDYDYETGMKRTNQNSPPNCVGSKGRIMTKQEIIKEKIEKLWMGTVDVKPEDYNFYEKREGDDWGIPFERTDKEMENDEFFPTMNYRYPVPDLDRKSHSNNKIKKASG